MPNWCVNTLTIQGEGASNFLAACKGKVAHYNQERVPESFRDKDEARVAPFTLNALVPVPEYILQAGYDPEGYHWQIANWGTKWDVDPDVDDQRSDYIHLSFDSAWTPPVAWVDRVAQLFPSLRFILSYYEPGIMFAGYIEWSHGDRVQEQEVQGDCQEFWDLSGLDRDEFYSDDDSDVVLAADEE